MSITITPSVRSLERHLADNPLSTGRLSEYPTDYFVGICIETSAMAEQNTLRLPPVDFSDCRLRLLPLLPIQRLALTPGCCAFANATFRDAILLDLALNYSARRRSARTAAAGLN